MIRNDASRREKLVLGRRGVSVRLRGSVSQLHPEAGIRKEGVWEVEGSKWPERGGGEGDGENTAPGI